MSSSHAYPNNLNRSTVEKILVLVLVPGLISLLKISRLCLEEFVIILRRRRLDFIDRYCIVNPTVGRRPDGIFLDE
jgi:hypothetical protein